MQEKTINVVNCHVVTDVPSAPGHSQKRELSPGAADCQLKRNHKIGEKCFLCHSIVLCPTYKQCPKYCTKTTLGAILQNLWQTWLDLGAGPKSSSNTERRLLSPLSDPAKTDKISHCRKLLCTSSQEQLPVGGITSADRQKCSGASMEPNISRVFQPTIFGPRRVGGESPLGTYPWSYTS